MKVLKCILKAFATFLGICISLGILIHFITPVYYFDETQPFKGEYLHNPYQDIDSAQWQLCNFHAHTRKYSGLTDGRNTSEELIDSVYNSFGFTHAGISDYNYINRHGENRPGYIPGYEHGWGLFKIHQLCLGAEKVWLIDFPLFQTVGMKQFTINNIARHSRLVVPAHPSFVKQGYLVEDMKYLTNYKLMEVLNGFRVSAAHWDMALSTGHLVYLIGDDDLHDATYINDPAYRFTMIHAKENDAEQLLTSLEKGMAVGVEFPLNDNETFPQKAERLKKNLPYLNYCKLNGDTLSVNASKKMAKVVFSGQEGKTLAIMENIDTAAYVIQPEDNYVRVVMTFADGSELWLNPTTRHASPNEVAFQRFDHVSYWKTAVKWALCLAALVLATRCIIRRRKIV